jgi:hypothetical protein
VLCDRGADAELTLFCAELPADERRETVAKLDRLWQENCTGGISAQLELTEAAMEQLSIHCLAAIIKDETTRRNKPFWPSHLFWFEEEDDPLAAFEGAYCPARYVGARAYRHPRVFLRHALRLSAVALRADRAPVRHLARAQA